MQKKELPIKTVYYKDELKDEFASDNIKAKKIDKSYKYIDKSFGFHFLRFVAYRLLATPLAYLYCKIKLGHRIKNKKCLKAVRGEGFFLFGNHTQQTADAFIPSLSVFPRSVYVIVHPNNVSMPVLGKINHYLGAIPTPDDIRAARNFKNAVEKRILEGKCVAVYPEAHIWPFYTGIRPFSDSSVKLAVEFEAPCFTMTTVYKKRKFRSVPRAVTYIDGPFYPDLTLPKNERSGELRDRLYEAMKIRSLESDCEYIRYVKKD